MNKEINLKNFEFKKTFKREYDVWVSKPKIGTEVYNRFENCDYLTSEKCPYVISGTVGEVWIIDIDKLKNTYLFIDGSEITEEKLDKLFKNQDWINIKTRIENRKEYFAANVPLEIIDLPVKTSWGYTLYANMRNMRKLIGDFIVCSSRGEKPNLDEVWVVNGEVFRRTYDLTEFSNICEVGRVYKTPRPCNY